MMKFFMDRPVVDQTGLKGRYDLGFKWTFDEASAPADGTVPPGLFTASAGTVGVEAGGGEGADGCVGSG